MSIQIKNFSFIYKIVDGKLPKKELRSDIKLSDETYFYQAVIKPDEELKNVKINIVSELKEYVKIYRVKNVFANKELGWLADDYVIKSKNSEYPELLLPAEEISVRKGEVATFLICIYGKQNAGVYDIVAEFFSSKRMLGKTTLTLKILSESLPDTDFFVTHWLYPDCIAELHGVKPFDDEFYAILKNYLREYVFMGNDTLLLPLLTPALDTEVGKERMTTQLVKIAVNDGQYSFDFSEADKYISVALAAGIKNFELSHLFTQWGAEFCPKIVATENGEEKKIFGWNDKSNGDRYTNFLKAFLPAVAKFFRNKGLEKNVFVHLSDEPNEKHIDLYSEHYALVKILMPEFVTLDAMSSYDFYEKKVVDLPVVSISHARPFIRNGVKHAVYYCNCECQNYETNRFLAMSALRCRVLGFAAYYCGAAGFLHWGFNFYHTGYSKKIIDPFKDNSAGGYFPSGDSFLVYPDIKGGGCFKTLRLCYLLSAMQDRRVCILAERLYGKNFIKMLLAKYGFCGYNVYPHSEEFFEKLRKDIYKFVERKIKK